MLAAPKVENQNILTAVGTSSTTMTDSRIVRPLEMRAIKLPTNGHQAIQVAQ